MTQSVDLFSNNWPFKDMEVGDLVDIEPKLAKKGQRYVHIYANRVGKKFRTKISSETKWLIVKRIK